MFFEVVVSHLRFEFPKELGTNAPVLVLLFNQ